MKELTALAFRVFSFSFPGGQPLMGLKQTLLSPRISCYSNARGTVTPGEEAPFVTVYLQRDINKFCSHFPIKV